MDNIIRLEIVLGYIKEKVNAPKLDISVFKDYEDDFKFFVIVDAKTTLRDMNNKRI
jgi:hypothetical protein